MTHPRSHVVLAFFLVAAGSPAAVPWHPPFYLGNGGYWRQRVALTLTNPAAEPVAGEPVSLALPGLEGARVESLRACRADGIELLYDLRDARGHPKRRGTLAAGDVLRLPAECAGRGTATLFVYAGNPLAGAVPEFLPGGFVNGGFESGDDSPAGWERAHEDDRHRLAWDESGGRGNSRAVRAEVEPGAPASWVQWQQSALPVKAGRRYAVRGWVRAEDVRGTAGWYVHVHGERPQLINQTLNAGQGTFGWKQVATSFVAPTNARTATLGTVLHGTGRAWFDDAAFVETDGPAALPVSAGALERLALDTGDPVFPEQGSDFLNRAEIVVRNVDTQPVAPALVRVNLGAALARLPGVPRNTPVRVRSGAGHGPPAYRLASEGDLLIAVDLPPRSERRFHIGFPPAATPGAATVSPDESRLLESPANLATNASFEHGTPAPDGFTPPRFAGATRGSAGFSSDARFGGRSLEMTVRDNPRAEWVGWHSAPIAVKPGASYLLSGWLKGVGLKASATLHAHFHDARGALCASGAMTSTGPAISGDADWSPTRGFLVAPPDAATIRLHLTLSTEGTLRHDGLILCEVLDGHLERVFSAAAGAPPPGAPLHVWEVNPLVKVFPDTPPQTASRGVRVELGRNEFEPVQLAVREPFGVAVRGIALVVSPLTNRAGAALPPVKTERVGFVPVDHPSGYYRTDVPEWCRKVPRGSGATDGWAGEWPDPLVPCDQFDLAPHRTQPLWLTVRTPHHAEPGEYLGTITLRTPNTPALTLPLSVQVLPFTLPHQTRLRAIYDFRRGPGGWHGPDGASDPERAKWLRFIAEHRLGIDGIEPPPKFALRDGQVTMDAAGFDATARLCFDELGMNVSYTPWFFYMFGWAYPPKKLFGFEPFTPEWTRAFRQAYQLFTDHLREKGWHDKFVYYISDEPHFHHPFVVDQMSRLCALIHSVDRQIPVYSSTWRHCAPWDDALDLWGVGQYGCFPVAEMRRLRQAGKQIWFTCDGQQATDTPYLATERMLPYYCWKYGATGFEFWGISWWTHNPWTLGWHQYIRQSDDGKRHYWIRYPNGDGYLAYPGQPVGVDGPVSTIRLEQVREGLEDFEVLTLLAQAAAKARAKGQPTDAADHALAMAHDLVTIPNTGGLRSTAILPDPDRLPAARRAVNAALAALMR
ncbi:MAG: DUF4091 domain-containing protein [Verrucomicrobia bacterium]|nr:DUF4091 domain-containing protein [Verrucomicrobiota bacterium]